MAAIERGLVNSRCGDGRDLDRPDENAIEKFKGGDVSSEPKSPPPPTKPRALFFSEWLLLNSDIDSSDTASDSDGERHRLRGAKLCPYHTCEPEYKPTVKIGSFCVPDFMEAFVEKMIASYLDNTNSVLVTDLSVYVSSNSDLADLCRPYGNVTSADLAIDQESGQWRSHVRTGVGHGLPIISVKIP